MSPKIVNKEERKSEIAAIALEVFDSKGFEKASINDIAKKAGMAKGSIYDYFSSKEDLVLYTVQFALDMFKQKETEALKEQDPRRQLRSLITGMVDYSLTDKRAFKMFATLYHMMLSRQMPARHKQRIFRHFLQASSMIEAIIHAGITQGVFRKDPKSKVRERTINLMAYLDGIFLYYFIDPKQIDIARLTRVHIDTFLRELTG